MSLTVHGGDREQAGKGVTMDTSERELQQYLTEPAHPHTFVPSLFSDGPGAER
jgi:hypothetical protein